VATTLARSLAIWPAFSKHWIRAVTSADALTRLMTLDIPSACSIAQNPFGFRSRHAALRQARDKGTRPNNASTVAREAKTMWWTGVFAMYGPRSEMNHRPRITA